MPVTVAVTRRTHRRPGAHTPPGGEPHPLTVVAFDSRQLRRSVISVLVIVTLWLVALGVFSAIGHFFFILMLSWLFAIAMEPAILRLTARGMRRGTATGVVGSFVVVFLLALGALFGNLFFQQLAQLVTSLPTTVEQSVSWVNSHTQLQLDPATRGAQAGRIQHQVGDLEHLGTDLAALAADQGPQAGFEFLDREGLGEVVVGAGGQAGQLFVEGVAGGQHQHRRRLACLLAQALAHLHAVQARQHQVQHDHVVAVLRGQAVAVQAVGGVIDFKTTAFEELADHFGDVAVVFDDQDQTGRLLRCAHVGNPLASAL